MREILLREASRIEQRHGERIAHRKCRRGAGRGSEIERAGFFRNADVERYAGGLRERGAHATRHHDERYAEPFQVRQQQNQLRRLSRIG